MDSDFDVLDDNLHDDYAGTEDLVLDSQIISYLEETGKWARFLSILGFVGIGLMVVASFFVGTIMSMAGAGAMEEIGAVGGSMFLTFIYLLMAALYFFPVLYLYRFGTKIKTAVVNDDQALLSEAFMNLKSHYKFIGVLAMVVLSIYAIIFVITIFGVMAF